MVIQSELNTELFEITPINADLVNSIDQVYALRQLAIHFFCNQTRQSLQVTDEIERARAIVALVDVLWRSNIQVKVLILAELSKSLEQIEKSFQLHTDLTLNSLSGLKGIESNIHFIRYQNILNSLSNKETENYLNQFDLIITDHIETEKNELINKRLKNYKQWLLNITLPEKLNVLL